ncbi:MAG: hypothetical protein HUJ22_10460 [Gracilimonas sp.]|uniref:hypothetical protein n=1 Tax=Gracilimonas sp. TaxID=1974203 RepID=UPI00198EC490|nr:hypothetical protein [Gracilimonas sp.]MBD3616982.1 hypothetical protein [Gracilimonas sp.]
MQNLPKTAEKGSMAETVSVSSHKQQRRCQFCGQIAELVWVHGHGQCAACGINAEECCRGETCG